MTLQVDVTPQSSGVTSMVDQASSTLPESDRDRTRRRSVVAIGAGNLLEWYDFAVYASLASLLGKLLFPAADPLASLLATFSVFAVGYLARPVGAAVFGRLADNRGRKVALTVVISLMGVATILIGLIPTYATVGVIAPILLVLARVAQGLSVGGEFSASVSYLVEMAPPGMRGLYGAIVYLTANLGFAVCGGDRSNGWCRQLGRRHARPPGLRDHRGHGQARPGRLPTRTGCHPGPPALGHPPTGAAARVRQVGRGHRLRRRLRSRLAPQHGSAARGGRDLRERRWERSAHLGPAVHPPRNPPDRHQHRLLPPRAASRSVAPDG